MDNLPKLLALFKDFVANFGGHILLVNHVLLIHITDNFSSTTPLPVDYILFATLCALQKGLREAISQDGETSFFDVPIISSLRRQREMTYLEVHQHIVWDRARGNGKTICQSFADLMEELAQLPRATHETFMMYKHNSSVLESVWWELEAHNPDWDALATMTSKGFEQSVAKSYEPIVILVDFSIAIESILEHYKRKNLAPHYQQMLSERLKKHMDIIILLVKIRQRKLDDERIKQQQSAKERARTVGSHAKKALKAAEKALAKQAEESTQFGRRRITAAGEFPRKAFEGLP